MPWHDGHFRISHPREPWKAEPPIFVHAPLNTLKGKAGTKARGQYTAAKRSFDMNAAVDVVARCISKSASDRIVSYVLGGGRDAIIVMPHPAFDDDEGAASVSTSDTPLNAIPFAYAGYLCKTTGCSVDEELVQSARVGRTKLSKWARFIYQPSFGGAVRTDRPYIIADDVTTTAGTMAALRSYIVRNGGHVLFCTALANQSGREQLFSITPETQLVLKDALGVDFEPYWLETVGHSLECLTEFEGRFLRGWCDEQAKQGHTGGDKLLQRLRDRIDEAAATCG